MTAAIENYLSSKTELTTDDIARVSALAITRKLRRNEHLLREGKVCRHKAFIAGGLLRTFAVKPDGGEHILQFSPEDTWTLDVESYDRQIPSRYNIAAVEPAEVLFWTKGDFNTLLAEIPRLKTLSDQLVSQNIHSSRQRLLTALSGTPEEKYEDFVRNSHGLLSRLPLRMIASYLGVSLKTLNRVRHAQLLRS